MFLIFNPYSGASGDMLLAALERLHAHLLPEQHEQMLSELSFFVEKVTDGLASISFRGEGIKGPFSFAFADVNTKEASHHAHWKDIRKRLTSLESEFPSLADARETFRLIATA
ncbi:MAG: nickel insertion protein [Planctomycetota bacterium]|nr:nickel insertion protein [Planctomycetota bacterium]